VGAGLWLDSRLIRDIGFVSHAHRDHWRSHRRLIATPATLALARERAASVESIPLAFGETLSSGRAQISLHPAGHILGAAQVLLECDGVRVLYTGDTGPGGPCVPAPVYPRADILIMETTWGLARHRLPPAREVVGSIARWCESRLRGGITPVLLAYSLGKTQRLMAELGSRFAYALEAEAYEMSRVYECLGAALPPFRILDGQPAPHEVVICPPARLASLTLPRFHAAMVTGWAGAGDFLRGRTAFPLSEHHDFDGLVRLVDAVQPALVLTVHGYAEEFARTLRRRGVRAQPLREREQLELFPVAS
jgi:Cft2 family RNA processing exonuclease